MTVPNHDSNISDLIKNSADVSTMGNPTSAPALSQAVRSISAFRTKRPNRLRPSGLGNKIMQGPSTP
jgi:hypothetical protein